MSVQTKRYPLIRPKTLFFTPLQGGKYQFVVFKNLYNAANAVRYGLVFTSWILLIIFNSCDLWFSNMLVCSVCELCNFQFLSTRIRALLDSVMLSKRLLYYNCDVGAHHLDLRVSTPEDPDWLIKQRTSEIQLIRGWINDYDKHKSRGSAFSM